jgi:gliding motility-associated-like protein
LAKQVNIGESCQFEIISLPGNSFYWKAVDKPDLQNSRETDKVRYLSARDRPVIHLKWDKAGTYFLVVTVIHQGGCSNIKAYPVVVTEEHIPVVSLFIPEAISPNGDGLNDQFIIKGLSVYPNTSLTILGRDGVVIYMNSDYQNDWAGVPNKGNLSGRPVPSGTYYYILCPGGTKRMIKGFVYVGL